MPFEDVAPIVGRSPTAARQLASRARRRVRAAPEPDTDLEGQWVVVDAFIAASRAGDIDGLLAVLDPEVELRSDGGRDRPNLTTRVHGAAAVAGNALIYRRAAETATRTLVNGAAGVVAWNPDGRPFALLAPTIRGGRIVAIDVLVDPLRLAGLPLVRGAH
jgi:RNA polymerase sigma-70 factor (ECF subfamily)